MTYTTIQDMGYLRIFYANQDTSRIYYTDSRLNLIHGPFMSSNEAVEHWCLLTHPLIKEYTSNKPSGNTPVMTPTYNLPDHSFTENSEDKNVIHVDFINKVRIK